MAYSWFILLLTIAGTAFLLLLLQGTSFGDVLHERIPDRPRRRLFVASLSFFLTFAGVRAVVYAIEHQIPPFHSIRRTAHSSPGLRNPHSPTRRLRLAG